MAFESFVLIGFSIYHLVAGICALGPESWLKKFAKSLYSLSLSSHPAFFISMKAIGVFAIYTSVSFAVVETIGSEKLKFAFVLLAGLLVILRGLIRFFYQDKLIEGFELSSSRNKKHSIFNILLGAIIIGFSVYRAL